MSTSDTTAWRVMLPSDYEAMQAAGAFLGSPLDLKDGFIHMSPTCAAREVGRLYFKGEPKLVLLQVDLGKVAAAALRWDFVPSRGVTYPHLYPLDGAPASLPLAAVTDVHILTADGDDFSGFPPALSS